MLLISGGTLNFISSKRGPEFFQQVDAKFSQNPDFFPYKNGQNKGELTVFWPIPHFCTTKIQYFLQKSKSRLTSINKCSTEGISFAETIIYCFLEVVWIFIWIKYEWYNSINIIGCCFVTSYYIYTIYFLEKRLSSSSYGYL